MKGTLDPRIIKQIRSLLQKPFKPIVKVDFSGISGAGNGVYAAKSFSSKDIPTVMCLYPGIYTPGLPIHAATNLVDCENHYLANHKCHQAVLTSTKMPTS